MSPLLIIAALAAFAFAGSKPKQEEPAPRTKEQDLSDALKALDTTFRQRFIALVFEAQNAGFKPAAVEKLSGEIEGYLTGKVKPTYFDEQAASYDKKNMPKTAAIYRKVAQTAKEHEAQMGAILLTFGTPPKA